MRSIILGRRDGSPFVYNKPKIRRLLSGSSTTSIRFVARLTRGPALSSGRLFRQNECICSYFYNVTVRKFGTGEETVCSEPWEVKTSPCRHLHCRRLEEPKIGKHGVANMWVYISYMGRRNPLTDWARLFIGGRYPWRNHDVITYWHDLVTTAKGCGVKFKRSHCLYWSSLQHVSVWYQIQESAAYSTVRARQSRHLAWIRLK